LDKSDVIVWAPDDFQVPTKEQREYFEDWLRQGDSRTLVYIGRDYDGSITYWQKMQQGAPAAEANEIARRLAEAQTDYTSQRSDMPADQYCGWFTARRDGKRRDVRTLSGPFSEGIDATKVEIELLGRLDVPTRKEVRESGDDEDSMISFDSPFISDEPSWRYEPPPEEYEIAPDDEFEDPEEDQQLPDGFEVLLESEGDALVTRFNQSPWTDSQIVVVTNGSFLLNVPLVNHEHRKLAGRLIDECGPPGKVVFLESGPGGPPISDDESARFPTGMEALIVWPLGCILMHLIVVGIIFMVSRFPIFGRPREPESEAVSDFGKHIDALGELLALTGDHHFATGRLAQYQQTVKGEGGKGE